MESYVFSKIIAGFAAVVISVSGFIFPSHVRNQKVGNDEIKRFSSEEELKDAISKTRKKDGAYGGDGLYEVDAAVNESTSIRNDNNTYSPSTSDESNNHSETNTQVAGVDEADIIKTNGKYIYYISNNILHVVNAIPASNMEEIKTIDLSSNGTWKYKDATELYIDDSYITVIGTETRLVDDNIGEDDIIENRINWYHRTTETLTTINIYKIDNYKLVRTFEISGNYISSRKIDNNIVLISNKYIYSDYGILPICKDSSVSKEYKDIPANEICYFKDFEDCNYMIISTIDLKNIDEKANVQTFFGASTEIYMNKDSLYVAKICYDYSSGFSVIDTNGFFRDISYSYTNTTKIHKFDIKGGKVQYCATGVVPGSLLNQFSMDEYNGYFRITTTDNSNFEESTNNLYVLDSNMNIVGKLENLAKGEKIYSTRFMGTKCYMVTYKTVDPLFVIDISNPTSPRVLGELKIPGYSKYLHPIGENYLIGFGEDSIEKSYMDWNGEQRVTAYTNGLKLAIFDVSDFNNPKEIHSIKIGGRGSYSELLYNHKALLYDEERGIFAFPATICKEAGTYDNGVPMYGKTEFAGVLVYNLSVEDGISLRGKINHNNGKVYYHDIERVLYIGDVLYTASPNMIKANNINTIEEVGRVYLKK